MRREEISVEAMLGGRPLSVRTVKLEEKLSSLACCELTCDVPAGGAHEPVGERLSLEIRDGWGAVRKFSGLVTEAHMDLGHNPSLWFQAASPAVPLTLCVRWRTFRGKSVRQIVEEITSQLSCRWELGRRLPLRRYVAQCDESDWAFVERLLAEHGLYYLFDQEGALVIGDDSRASPAAELPQLKMRSVEGGVARDPFLRHFGVTASSGPALHVVERRDLHRGVPMERASAGSGPRHRQAPFASVRRPDPGALARWGDERATAARSGAAGAGPIASLVAGRTIRVDNQRHDEWLITSSSADYARESRDPLNVEFRAVPVGVPFRPEPAQPRSPAGLQFAEVVADPGDEAFPDALGRVRAALLWDSEDGRSARSGTWARASQRVVDGSLVLPRAGATVAVVHEEGSADSMRVLQRMFDEQHEPPYALPALKERVSYKTPTTQREGTHNEILFEDRDGSEQLKLTASLDMSEDVIERSTSIIAQDRTRTVGADESVSIASNLQRQVAGNESLTVAGTCSVRVNATLSEQVQGSSGTSVAGGMAIAVGGSASLSVGGMRAVTVAGDAMETAAQQMRRAVAEDALSVVVGNVSHSANGIGWSVGGPMNHEVGGSLAVSSEGALQVSTGTDRTDSIGGDLKMDAKNSIVENSERCSVEVDDQLLANGSSLVLMATKSLVVHVGRTAIVMDPTSITVTAPSLDLSGAELQLVSKFVRHN